MLFDVKTDDPHSGVACCDGNLLPFEAIYLGDPTNDYFETTLGACNSALQNSQRLL